jgi:hypothetical protein
MRVNDRSHPDMELQARVEILFRLWNDIRWVFRALPKPEQVGPMNRRRVTDPPTRQAHHAGGDAAYLRPGARHDHPGAFFPV